MVLIYHKMNNEIIVIINNVRSRENVGSIFRTADAAGISKLYLCGILPPPPHEKISKTTIGAETIMPWEYHKQTWRLIEDLKKRGYMMVALEKTKSSEDIFSARGGPAFGGSKPLALILGNEVSGISPEILKRADKKLAIPMYGQKESLNVAVAFGVAVYTLRHSKDCSR